MSQMSRLQISCYKDYRADIKRYYFHLIAQNSKYI